MKNEQKAPPCPQKFSWRLQPEGGEKKKKKKKGHYKQDLSARKLNFY